MGTRGVFNSCVIIAKNSSFAISFFFPSASFSLIVLDIVLKLSANCPTSSFPEYLISPYTPSFTFEMACVIFSSGDNDCLITMRTMKKMRISTVNII